MTERWTKLEVDWTARYEDLRAAALGAVRSEAIPQDLARLLARGLASWMVAIPGPSPSSTVEVARTEVEARELANSLRQEAAMVLLSMALVGGRGEEA